MTYITPLTTESHPNTVRKVIRHVLSPSNTEESKVPRYVVIYLYASAGADLKLAILTTYHPGRIT